MSDSNPFCETTEIPQENISGYGYNAVPHHVEPPPPPPPPPAENQGNGNQGISSSGGDSE